MALKARNILVGLDFTDTDDAILTFLADNINAFDASRFSFLHVSEEAVSGGDEDRKSSEIAQKITQLIERKLPIQAQAEIRVEFESPQDTIRKIVHEEKVDYLILGNKDANKKEVKPNELVKKPACSIILIPEKKAGRIKTIGVPTDFSNLSKFAFKAAVDFIDNQEIDILGFHSYEVPSGYHKSGKDHHEFAEVMEKHAKDDAERFKKELGVRDFPVRYMYQEDKSAAESIVKFKSDEDVDMLVLGSKGRTAAASLLLGSVTSEVVDKLRSIPILIVKEKDENMDMVDALKKV